MNIAAECPECCACPQPLFRGRSASVSKYKYGHDEPEGFKSTPPKRYLKKVEVRSAVIEQEGNDYYSGSDFGCPCYREVITVSGAGSTTITDEFSVEGVQTSSTVNAGTITLIDYTEDAGGYDCDHGEPYEDTSPFGLIGAPPYTWTSSTSASGASEHVRANYGGASSCLTLGEPADAFIVVTQVTTGSITLSVENKTADVIGRAEAALAVAFAAATSGPLLASRNVSKDELTVELSKFAYETAFPIPKIGNGKCWRGEWVERFVAEVVYDTASPFLAVGGGASITAVEVIDRGVYRPAVSIEGLGSDAQALAVMAPGGAVSSVRILNPGKGYTEAPEVIFSWGDAAATAVVDSDVDSPNYGQITAINVTAGGDYRPELNFNAPPAGGTQAAATVTLDPTGGIASVNVTNAGSCYEIIACNIGGLFIHYGTETARCFKWSGAKPEGYDEGDNDTWPKSPEYVVEPPGVDGSVHLELKRVVCNCSDCP